MPETFWDERLRQITAVLGGLGTSDGRGLALEPDRAFAALVKRGAELRAAAGTLFMAGNGASAGLASHSAGDLLKNVGLRTMVLTDPALLTAFGNDRSYVETFSGPLEILLRTGDMLTLISSSGRSPNVLAAAAAARRAGVFLITFSAMDRDNPLRKCGDLNFYLPAAEYGLAESGHAVLLHHWIDLAEAEYKTSRNPA